MENSLSGSTGYGEKSVRDGVRGVPELRRPRSLPALLRLELRLFQLSNNFWFFFGKL